MTALAEDRKTSRKDGILFGVPMAATKKCYAGALANLDASGYAKPAEDTTGEKFLGVVNDSQVDNSSGVNAALNLEGRKTGSFQFAASGMAQSDLNADAYIVDDQTVGLGIIAQPVNVTGVVLARIPTSKGGAYALAWTIANTSLKWGGGTAVSVVAGGDFTLTAPDGSQIKVTVTAAALPGADKSDTITLRNVKCGVIADVESATSVYVDISR